MNEIMMSVVIALSILGNVLVVKNNRWGFAAWMISNVVWIIYDINKTAYSQAVLMLIYFGMAAWGFITWGKNKKEKSK